mgnify:CR=1 FL=1|jgi:hypothetical protein
MPNVIPLKPARPDVEGPVPSYGPQIPWRWILPAIVLVVAVGGGYWLRRQQQMNALRLELKEAHASLKSIAEPYRDLREQLEQWIAQAASGSLKPYVDPRLQLEKLHKGKGLYLRVPLAVAKDSRAVQHAIELSESDSIPSCLGLNPELASQLYVKGNFLMPDWIASVDVTENPVRLRVMDDELARRARRDAPKVAEILKSEWFLLVLQHGENRRDAPVDVHLWSLSPKAHLLSATIHANGMIVTARNDISGKPALAKKAEVKVGKGAANDCSIAAQLQSLTVHASDS